MASLDKESIEELARGALDALRGSHKDDDPLEEVAADLRQQVERVVDTIQKEYGQTRLTARDEIDGFLNDLKGIDPALPGIVAAAANKMTGRKSRRGLALLGVIVALLAGAATLLWLRNPDAYRRLTDAANRTGVRR
jgi:hypothetical protein